MGEKICSIICGLFATDVKVSSKHLLSALPIFLLPLAHNNYNDNNNNNKRNVKTDMIPVITGATGTISKSFRKCMSNVPGKHEVKELQKTAILGTAHILRKVLMYKYNRFNTS
jgi:hypothetical protein